MELILDKFEKHCTTPGVNSRKAPSYRNAIDYLCDFLNINNLTQESIQKLNDVIDSTRDKNSDFYQSLLLYLKDRHKSSYLEGGFIKAALPVFLEFIKNDNIKNFSLDLFPDSDQTNNCMEGAKITVMVNKYERSTEARNTCISKHGCFCHICDMNFEKMYGKLGKDFIHVHHIIPLNEIKSEYIVNPEVDLIPVCPNCHAMLHRKVNGKNLSVSELKEYISLIAHK